MELFTKILPEGTLIYRGHANIKDKPFKIGQHVWFALNEDHAKQYGKHITTFNLTRPVTLLINCHQTFLHDFSFKVTEKYKKIMDRLRALMPLGLPDLQTQQDFGMTLSIGLYDERKLKTEEDIRIKRTIDCNVGSFGHKHRCSKQSEGEMFDDHMVIAMKEIYHNSHNGYICPLFWASIHHAGSLTPELCLFDANQYVRRVRENSLKKGGSFKKETSFNTRKQLVGADNERRYYDNDMEMWIALNPAH